jgi:hypothetical protein
MNEKMQKNLLNKKNRYKVGFIFYALFLTCEITNFFYSHFDEKNIYSPFSTNYIQVSSMSLILIFYIIFQKFSSKQKSAVKLNLYYEQYKFFYRVRKDEQFALMDLENYAINSEEVFSKNLHKISIRLMLLFYFYMCFKSLSLQQLNIKSVDSTVIFTSLITTLILRKIMLRHFYTGVLNIIAFIINLLGVIFIFIFQIEHYYNDNLLSFSQLYSVLSGVSFSFLICLIKYHYNQYGINFNIFLIYGFSGLYCLILVPFIIFIATIFQFEDRLFEINNIYLFLLSIFTNSILRNIFAAFSIIYLSPLVFILGMTLTVPIIILIDLFYGQFSWRIDYFFVIGCGLLIFSFLLMLIDKMKRLKTTEYVIYNDDEESTYSGRK